MSFQFNSDREQIRGVDSTIVGSNSVRIRAGGGSNEREIIQAVIDSGTNLPRVGINRTGRRVERIDVLSPGTGYTDTPTINFSNPTLPGGFKPVATADTDSTGRIISILIDNPGDGYEIAPTVTIEGGGGFGANPGSGWSGARSSPSWPAPMGSRGRSGMNGTGGGGGGGSNETDQATGGDGGDGIFCIRYKYIAG